MPILFTIALYPAFDALAECGRIFIAYAIIKSKWGRRMREFTLRIENMHCGSCVRRVTQALAATDGLEVEEVRIGAARVRAMQDPPPIALAVAALANAGYPAAALEQ